MWALTRVWISPHTYTHTHIALTSPFFSAMGQLPLQPGMHRGLFTAKDIASSESLAPTLAPPSPLGEVLRAKPWALLILVPSLSHTSERWVVDLDGVVSLQCYLWARLAETQPELYQPGTSQRGLLL